MHCECMLRYSHVWLFATPWTIARQAPLSQDFSGKNPGVGCHFFLQGIFFTQGWNSHVRHLLHWHAVSLPLSHLGSPTSCTIRFFSGLCYSYCVFVKSASQVSKFLMITWLLLYFKKKSDGNQISWGNNPLKFDEINLFSSSHKFITLHIDLNTPESEPKVKSLSRVRLFATPWTTCSLPASFIHGIFQARVLSCHCLLQKIFPTQRSNPGLPHCRLCHLSHQRSSKHTLNSIP